MNFGLMVLSFLLGISLAVVTMFSIFQIRFRHRLREQKDPIDSRTIIKAVGTLDVRTPTQKERRTVWFFLGIIILGWIFFVAHAVWGRR